MIRLPNRFHGNPLLERYRQGLLAGLIGSALVLLIWGPLLNSQGHLVSVPQGIPKGPLRLDPVELKMLVVVCLAQGVCSGLCAARDIRLLFLTTILEGVCPWSFWVLWSGALAPRGGNVNLLEALAWGSIAIVLNVAVWASYRCLGVWKRPAERGKLTDAS